MADFSLFEEAADFELLDMSNGQPFDLFECGFSGIPRTIDVPSISQEVRLGTLWADLPQPEPVNPTIENVTLSGGANLPFKADVVLDEPVDGTINRIIVFCVYTSGVSEVIYDGTNFTPDFNAESVLTEVSSGRYRITAMRNGGWPQEPRVFVHANTDRGGMTTT